MKNKKIKRDIKVFLKIVLFFAVCICLYWVGDVWRAASYIEWYKLAGATALLIAVFVIAGLSLYWWMRDKEDAQRWIIVETKFSFTSYVGKYLIKKKIEPCQLSSFAEIAIREYVRKLELEEQHEEADQSNTG